MFIRLGAVLILLLAVHPSRAADSPIISVSPPGSGTSIIKINGETVVMKKIPGGAVGKMGGEKVIMLETANGVSIVKWGQTKLVCHNDAASGVLICK